MVHVAMLAIFFFFYDSLASAFFIILLKLRWLLFELHRTISKCFACAILNAPVWQHNCIKSINVHSISDHEAI